LIRQIRTLLYEQGFTIGGARQQMAGNGSALVEITEGKTKAMPMQNHMIREMIEEIEEALSHLS
jgi:DNA-binding transcriptional MerR regulator